MQNEPNAPQSKAAGPDNSPEGEAILSLDMAMPVASHPAFWMLDLEDVPNRDGLGFPCRAASAPTMTTASVAVENSITPPASTNGDQDSSWKSPSVMRICQNCHTTQTPFWRRSNEGFFCNACGLYLRTHKKMRPIALQQSRNTKRIKTRADICSNCSATETPLWRRINNSGETVCNACGLYFKLHGAHRIVQDAKCAPLLRCIGKKPRALLPKYQMDTSWHQYYPPMLSHEVLAMPTPQASPIPGKVHHRQITGYAEGTQKPVTSISTTTPIRPREMNLGGYAAQYSTIFTGNTEASNNPPGVSFFFPFSYGADGSCPSAGQIQQQQPQIYPTIVDGSLDDSMRWFSSTCLGTAFSDTAATE